MKRLYLILLIIIMIMVMVFETASSEEITIVGTGSGMSLLKKISEAFVENNPGVTISVPASIGSFGGIKTVGNNQFNIGRVARKIKDSEKHYELTYIPFARIPVVFFTNKQTKVANLAPGQICDIFSGEITNWQTVGGEDTKIKVVRREDGDSSLQVLLESFPGFDKIKQTTKSKIMYTDQETCQLVERKADTIAYSTLVNAKNYDVNVLSIDNVSSNSGKYPYVVTLAFVFKKENYNAGIKKFVEFVSSEKAHTIITAAGGIHCCVNINSN